jgi:hypothetical protein
MAGTAPLEKQNGLFDVAHGNYPGFIAKLEALPELSIVVNFKYSYSTYPP